MPKRGARGGRGGAPGRDGGIFDAEGAPALARREQIVQRLGVAALRDPQGAPSLLEAKRVDPARGWLTAGGGRGDGVSLVEPAGGEVASLKSSARAASAAASSSRPSRRMIIECRQLAWATMLMEPRPRAAERTESQMSLAVASSSLQMRTSSTKTAVSESGGTSRRPLASTGAILARASPGGWAADAASMAPLTRHALDVPGLASRSCARSSASPVAAGLMKAFANSSASRLSAAGPGIRPAARASRQMTATLSWWPQMPRTRALSSAAVAWSCGAVVSSTASVRAAAAAGLRSPASASPSSSSRAGLPAGSGGSSSARRR